MLIIILTSDRGHLLKRCLMALKSRITDGDKVLVIDDSCDQERGLSLATVKSVSPTRVAYLHASDAFELLSKNCSPDSLKWTHRTDRRDISPMRNLGLAIFAADEAHSVCSLIDDDVIPHCFDYMVRLLDNIEDVSFVAGPNISGVDEMDTITRLQRICQRLRSFPEATPVMQPQDVLLESAKVSPTDSGTVMKACDQVSGGCMFFNRVSAFALPFPPGYNEDWLWCLMRQHYGTRVYRLPHVVEHAPKSLRPTTEKDLLFEIVGEVILYLLIERTPQFSGLEWSSLAEVQARIPSALAAIQGAGLALYEDLSALRQKSSIARAAITADEVTSLFEICCNATTPRLTQRVKEWLQFLPNHATSFQLFLNNHGNDLLGLLQERMYAN